MKPEKTVFSSAFAFSVTEPLGTPEATQPLTSQIPGITTLPVSTPLQSTASPVGTEVVPTTEEFTHLSSNGTPVVPPGPSTPSPIVTFGNYQVILAEGGMRNPTLKGSSFLWPSQGPWLGTLRKGCLIPVSSVLTPGKPARL